MKKNMRQLVSLLLGLLFITAGFLIARNFVRNKPQAERRRPMSSMIPVVETQPLEQKNQPRFVDCLGTVIADKTAELRSQVAGRIIFVHTNLVEGAQVKRGDELMKLDPIDYELALEKAKADLQTAQASLRIEEGQQDVVRQELELMSMDESPNAYQDLMLRDPQLKAAKAAVVRAQLNVRQMELNLSRTIIRAPFDAVIVSKEADLGDYAQPSSILAQLVATDRFFIRASVPLSALDPLPELGTKNYPAEIQLPGNLTLPAQTDKLLPDLSDSGRMGRILLTANDPYQNRARPLLLNEVVRVRITGETAQHAALIPRKYLRDGNHIWMMDTKNKLRILPVHILQLYADDMLIQVDADPDMQLVTSTLAAAVEGMELRQVKPQQTDMPNEN